MTSEHLGRPGNSSEDTDDNRWSIHDRSGSGHHGRRGSLLAITNDKKKDVQSKSNFAELCEIVQSCDYKKLDNRIFVNLSIERMDLCLFTILNV